MGLCLTGKGEDNKDVLYFCFLHFHAIENKLTFNNVSKNNVNLSLHYMYTNFAFEIRRKDFFIVIVKGRPYLFCLRRLDNSSLQIWALHLHNISSNSV